MRLAPLLLLPQLPVWILLAVAGVQLSAAVDARTQATAEAAHSREQLSHMEAALRLTLDLETGVRGYVITGQSAFLAPYRQATAALPEVLGTLREGVAAQATPDRPAQLARISRIETLLERWQSRVGRPEIAVRGRSAQEAAALVARGTGKRLIDAVRAEAAAFTRTEGIRLREQEAAALARLQDLRRTLLEYGIAVIALSVLSGLLAAALISRSYRRVSLAAERLARGEGGVRLSNRGPQEVRSLSAAFNRMSEQLGAAQAEAQGRAADLATQNARMGALGDLSDWLQAARGLEEGGQILARALPTLLPGTRGSLATHNASRNLLVPLLTWGGETASGGAPDGCWALRRGETRWPQDSGFAPACLSGPGGGGGYVCVPLFSHGETLGILRVRPEVDGQPLPADLRETLPAVARQVALALAGLRLQERLHQQAIRDPLTGLFNRRWLEDALASAGAHAVATDEPLSLIALDVDHFKRFNDTFGHEAGDAVLVRVGAALRDLAPPGAVPARPGGEEFTLLLPGLDTGAAAALAERLRETVAGWSLSHAGMTLGQITVSLGVATLGVHAPAPEALPRVADEALYAAKAGGRNRVAVARGVGASPVLAH
ncbi:diguanylate cyclase (GGDEF)-like protein [Deinococcus sp. HSC-46F16]|uniref:diguanylate cyclase n=1 Tax=Deinococcus sp. HSC-46F16 TaxID=2910968 RepID=UPI0020A120DF|nr:diguanylate cyclase [Deinococcus sp. HSC-46F16]MCP2013659.1 diguanylate cyclase (GGDEF)-like protein [Deinococcus sp. HSC-46F16]